MGVPFPRGLDKRTRLFFVVVLMALVGHWGCTVRLSPSPREPRGGNEIPHFSYDKAKLQPRIHRVKDEESYWIEKVTFPSSMALHWVTAYHYVQKAGENPPTIIILPILAGNYFLSKNSARYLARRGFSCLRFERTVNPLDAEKGLRHTEMVLRHGIIDIRRAIDWLAEGNGGNSNRIGVLGISMGATVAALALEVDPRISSAAIVLGGGDIAAILATSREDRVVRFREGVMRAKGMGLDQFLEEATRRMCPVDPLRYASRAAPKNILMVKARFDRVIPAPCSEKLWKAMGRPTWISIPTGHYSSALFLWYIRHRVLTHFRQGFGMKG